MLLETKEPPLKAALQRNQLSYGFQCLNQFFSSVAQHFRILDGLPVLREQHCGGLAWEVVRTPLVGNEPLHAWFAMGRPNLDSAHHEGLWQIVPHRGLRYISSR